MSNFNIESNPQQVILVPSNRPNSPILPGAEDSLSPIAQGGVALVVIVGMTYFSQSLLKWSVKLIEALNKKNK
jgi:hypothetical protein